MKFCVLDTGKSYLGVCLALAFNEIRSFAERDGQAVGPIVILAYKNHALDEFLIDLLDHSKYEPNSDGVLIRCGNPDNEKLLGYKERATHREKSSQSILDERLTCQRNCKTVLKDWKDLARKLFDSTAQDVADVCNWAPRRGSKTSASIPCASALYNALYLFRAVGDIIPNDDEEERDQFEQNQILSILKDFHAGSVSEAARHAEMKVMDSVPLLVNDLDHWLCPTTSRLLFLLEHWIKGEVPPDKCTLDICPRAAQLGFSLCNVHRCSFGLCPKVKASGQFCVDHCCQALVNDLKQCSKQAVFDGSAFCVDHACFMCIECLEPASIDRRVHEACRLHTCKVPGCRRMHLLNHGYCHEHLCTACGTTLAADGLPKLKGFCENHGCVVPDCNNESVENGTRFCFAHCCKVCLGTSKKYSMVHPAFSQSEVCPEHKCAREDCGALRHRCSRFCFLHSCRVCLLSANENNWATEAILDEAPRNVCRQHALCDHVYMSGRTCGQQRLAGNSFCQRHAEVKKPKKGEAKVTVSYPTCCGVTSKKAKCKAANPFLDSGLPWYCEAHKKQKPLRNAVQEAAPTESPDDDDDEPADDGADRLFAAAIKLDAEFTSFVQSLYQRRQKDGAKVPFDTVNQFSKCGLCTAGSDCKLGAYANKNEGWCCKYHCSEHDAKLKASQAVGVTAEAAVGNATAAEARTADKVAQPTKKASSASTEEPTTEASSEAGSADAFNSEEAPEIPDVAAALDPDEMDMEYFEDEDNDNLERIREMTEIGRVDADEEEEEENAADVDEDSISDLNDDATLTEIIQLHEEFVMDSFCWPISVKRRYEITAKFLGIVCKLLEKMSRMVDEYVERARRDRAESAAHAYRKTRFIGATVVGAARKLQAIRKAEPCAIIVEEACEVMEPTLMSVLAVSSLRKLEMIGDHRQLPAFVQHCWFNIEMQQPSIKTSLFERLITGHTGHNRRASTRNSSSSSSAVRLPFSVLDEQRRMREVIADLTRPDYADVVVITDHESTKKQCIGDRLVGQQLARIKSVRSQWFGQGRLVPGLPHVIHFWDLEGNKESRPDVGLSACNLMEAKAITDLTKFLLLCGVPSSSISIITPYKGQQRVLLKELQANRCLPKFSRESRPAPGSTITVSTVDRYQGDENDVVILSLVRATPGNMFVALLNRFIVAVSRARLGFYVVGSVDAVVKAKGSEKGPEHWNRFIGILRQAESAATSLSSSSSSSASSSSSSGTVAGPSARMGVAKHIPICCPQHPLCCRLVAKGSDFPDDSNWAEFCKERCTHGLQCGHACGLPCHFIGLDKHNKQCNVKLKRPCERHAHVTLLCHQVERDAVNPMLCRFKCGVTVPYYRPECGHRVEIDCYKEDLFNDGTLKLADCEVIDEDFIQPACGHIIRSPTCHERRQYEKTPPECMEKVVINKRCGCKMEIRCSQVQQELTHPSICKKLVNFPRPRCGHQLSKKCVDRDAILANWSIPLGGEEPTVDRESNKLIVREYALYGAQELNCQECMATVRFVRQCQHEVVNVPCSLAFQYAAGTKTIVKCDELVSKRCPLCMSKIAIKCSLSHHFQEWQAFVADQLIVDTAPENDNILLIPEMCLSRVQKPTGFDAELYKKLLSCMGYNVFIVRNCGHRANVACHDLLRMIFKGEKLGPCKDQVTKKLDCGHEVQVACSSTILPVCKAKINEDYVYPCGVHKEPVKSCEKLSKLRAQNPPCKSVVAATRYRCGHSTTVTCYSRSALEKFSVGLCFPCGSEQPITLELGRGYCDAPIDASPCTELVNLKYVCGHVHPKIPCEEAFRMCSSFPNVDPCLMPVECASPLCGHEIQVLCSFKDAFMAWDPWTTVAEPHFQNITERIGEDGAAILGRVYDASSFKRYEAFEDINGYVPCEQIATVELPCNHSVRIRCCDAFDGRFGLCQQLVETSCGECRFVDRIKCHESNNQHLVRRCKNIIPKRCNVCKINEVPTECHQLFAECHEEVAATLPDCGHEITWMCGEQDNPMEVATTCRICAHNAWAAATVPLTDEAIAQNLAEYIWAIRERLQFELQKLPVTCRLIEAFDTSPEKVKSFIRAQEETLLMHMRNCQANDADYGPAPPPVMSTDAVSRLHLVFTDSQCDFDAMKPTNYGRGYRFELLTKSSLQSSKFANDGFTEIFVGVAFQLNTHDSLPPFRQTSRNKKNHKAESQEEAKANRQMTDLIKQGYDSIYVDREANVNNNNQRGAGAGAGAVAVAVPVASNNRCIYWKPNAVLRSYNISFRFQYQCCVCKEYYADEAGIFCSSEHLLCEECFHGYVGSLSETAGSSSVNKEDQLTCPECRSPYDLQAVAGHCSPAVFTKFHQVLTKLKSDKEVQQAILVAEAKHVAQLKQLKEQSDNIELRAQLLRVEITEILSLKCPRCKAVFVDFDGCFALTCSRNSCACGFCAWCLKDCGPDAHAHVINCAENGANGAVYSDLNAFNRHHSARRKKRIIEILNGEPDVKVQKRVKELIARELFDLGITL
jgi:hypothetical protein